MHPENITSASVGAFMVTLIMVFETCKAVGAQTKEGYTLDFAALVQQASECVLQESSERSLSETDREHCAWLVAMFVEKIGKPIVH